jgi:all-trans-retinol 13,14-reductase
MTERLGVSYKQHGLPTGRWDAIVIGSGLGGLTAASLLARHAGKRVLVLERHYTAGGFTHTFHRPGYEWDVGVHYVGDVHRPQTLMRRAFDHLSDGQLEWADMGDVYDTIVIGGDRYDFVAGRERFRARMHEYFPTQTAAIDRYLDAIRATTRRSKRFFLEKVLPPALATIAGPALRWPARNDIRRSVGDVLGEITSDPRLRGVLAGQYGDYGLPPGKASWFMHALLAGHYLGGGAYPVGGAGRIAETLMPGIERTGGAVVTSAEVARIIVENGRAQGVELAGGERVMAPIVISNAGVPITFGRLLSPEAAARAGVQPTVRGVDPSFAHVSLYVGIKADTGALGLSRANRWIYPDHDHDRTVARYLADPEAPLPVTYLSFPSAKDPDFARRYPGRTTIEAIGLAPYEWFAKWEGKPWKKRGEDYEALKKRLADRLLASLLAECPQLVGKIDVAELSTPLTTRHFAGHPHGEIYGLDHSPARFAARHLRPHTRIANLYLTGADICTAGIGGALMGGALTASAIAKQNMLSHLVAGASA